MVQGCSNSVKNVAIITCTLTSDILWNTKLQGVLLSFTATCYLEIWGYNIIINNR